MRPFSRGILLLATMSALPCGAGTLSAQDTAAVRAVEHLRDKFFGDTSTGLRRRGYRALTALIAPAPATPPDRWRLSPAVDVHIGGQQALGISAGGVLSRPVRPGPYPVRAELRLIGRFGITGSRDVSLRFLAPDLVADWRFFLMASAERMLRTPYFGPDNQAMVEDSLKERYGILYYRYALLRSTAFGVVQRRVAGPVWLHLGVQARHYRTSAIKEQPTLFAEDVAAGRLDDTTRYTGMEARVGIVSDTRDDWAAAHSGIYVELLAAFGRLRSTSGPERLDYTRYLVGFREFVTLGNRGRTVLALRQRLSASTDTLPYFLAYEQVTSGAPDDGVVGPRNIRLHGGGNQLASSQLFFSADLRREAVVLRADRLNPVRLWVFALADAGILWEPGISIATRRHQWTVGAGFRAQASKRGLAGLDVGWTDTGPGVSLVSEFAY